MLGHEMRINWLACLCLVVSVSCSSRKEDDVSEREKEETPEALVSVDFNATFPHKYWISDWSKDQSYPKGFRYKLLTVHHEEDDMIEMVVVLEQPGGLKDEMERMKISSSAAARTCAIFVDGLAKEYGIEFEELDLSAVRSAQDFERSITDAGWYEWQP